MLRNLVLQFLVQVATQFVQSGQLGSLLGGLLKKNTQAIVAGTPNTWKDILLQAVVSTLKDAISSGKLNDFIVNLLNGLLGTKSTAIPVAATSVVDVTTNGDELVFHHSDGSQHKVSL